LNESLGPSVIPPVGEPDSISPEVSGITSVGAVSAFDGVDGTLAAAGFGDLRFG
jgi:hypothetical protein